MHASYAHVPEFLKLYQNLAYYTQQGMEKYNWHCMEGPL